MLRKLIVPLVLSVSLLAGCSSIVIEDPAKYITVDEALEMFDNDETFGLIVSDTRDQISNTILPVLDQINDKYDYVFYYVDLKHHDLAREEEAFNKLISEDYMNLDSQYIPKIAMVVDGETKASLDKTLWYEWFETYYPLIQDAE